MTWPAPARNDAGSHGIAETPSSSKNASQKLGIDDAEERDETPANRQTIARRRAPRAIERHEVRHRMTRSAVIRCVQRRVVKFSISPSSTGRHWGENERYQSRCSASRPKRTDIKYSGRSSPSICVEASTLQGRRKASWDDEDNRAPMPKARGAASENDSPRRGEHHWIRQQQAPARNATQH